MADMKISSGNVSESVYNDVYPRNAGRRSHKPNQTMPENSHTNPVPDHRRGNATVTISKEAREQQNQTHFSNINDPNDHGYFTKIWDEDGNVVWDASWNNDVEQQKPETGMPPHGEPNLGQSLHWTEISRDLEDHGFYTNMTRQEIDHLEGYLRGMRTADDLNAFADKHTSGNLRQYLKDLAKAYGSNDKGHYAPGAKQSPHSDPKVGASSHESSRSERSSLQWSAISQMLADHGFYKNVTRQEIDFIEKHLRKMKSAKDLDIFAEKHTSGDLREFLKELAKNYSSIARGNMP